MKISYVSFTLTLTVCGVVSAFYLFRRNSETRDPHHLISVEENPSQLQFVDERRPPFKWADEAEIRQLNSVWADAAAKLAANNGNEMEEIVQQVSDRMKSICSEQWMDIVRPFYSVLKQRFDDRTPTADFMDDSEFEQYMSATLQGMNLLGTVELHAIPPNSSVVKWESMALTTLRNYRRMFGEKGRIELAESANRFIEQLTLQIESNDGLTRQYMNYLKERNLRWLVAKGYSSRELALRGIGSYADMLKAAGYTPKWLSEFDDLSEAVK